MPIVAETVIHLARAAFRLLTGELSSGLELDWLREMALAGPEKRLSLVRDYGSPLAAWLTQQKAPKIEIEPAAHEVDAAAAAESGGGDGADDGGGGEGGEGGEGGGEGGEGGGGENDEAAKQKQKQRQQREKRLFDCFGGPTQAYTATPPEVDAIDPKRLKDLLKWDCKKETQNGQQKKGDDNPPVPFTLAEARAAGIKGEDLFVGKFEQRELRAAGYSAAEACSPFAAEHAAALGAAIKATLKKVVELVRKDDKKEGEKKLFSKPLVALCPVRESGGAGGAAAKPAPTAEKPGDAAAAASDGDGVLDTAAAPNEPLNAVLLVLLAHRCESLGGASSSSSAAAMGAAVRAMTIAELELTLSQVDPSWCGCSTAGKRSVRRE